MQHFVQDHVRELIALLQSLEVSHIEIHDADEAQPIDGGMSTAPMAWMTPLVACTFCTAIGLLVSVQASSTDAAVRVTYGAVFAVACTPPSSSLPDRKLVAPLKPFSPALLMPLAVTSSVTNRS